jgi:hypothetical protein
MDHSWIGSLIQGKAVEDGPFTRWFATFVIRSPCKVDFSEELWRLEFDRFMKPAAQLCVSSEVVFYLEASGAWYATLHRKVPHPT